MKRKYRIKLSEVFKNTYMVQTYFLMFGWLTIKEFQDEDIAFAKREAEELLEKLEEK